MANDKIVRVSLCAFLVSLTILTVLACLLTWRAVRILMHIEETVALAGRDVQSLTHSVAEMGQSLEEITDRLVRMEEDAERATGLDDAQNALEVLGDVRKDKYTNPQRLSPEAEAEIKFLIERIRAAKAEFICGSKHLSPTYFSLHLWAKYRYFKKTLASADEFIEKAATETISGYKYRVAFADGTSVDLATWLRQQLMEHRKARAEAP